MKRVRGLLAAVAAAVAVVVVAAEAAAAAGDAVAGNGRTPSLVLGRA